MRDERRGRRKRSDNHGPVIAITADEFFAATPAQIREWFPNLNKAFAAVISHMADELMAKDQMLNDGNNGGNMTASDDTVYGHTWSEPQPMFKVEVINQELRTDDWLTQRTYDSSKQAYLDAFTRLGFVDLKSYVLPDDRPAPDDADIVIRRVPDRAWQVCESTTTDGIGFHYRRSFTHKWD